MLASAGVLIGFSGTGGTPLLSSNEIEWLTSQNEYRPTEYVQGWLKFWFEEDKRLKVAKVFQDFRIEYIRNVWSSDRDLQNEGFYSDDMDIKQVLERFSRKIRECSSITDLLLAEALLTKTLYKIAANRTNETGFIRNFDGIDDANAFLNHGNYLAYGLAATTLWVLGIPHGFAVMHGKTHRGALVFDVAELIKDTLILPWAFICAKEGATEQVFRQQCLQKFTQHKALDFMFNSVKKMSKNGEYL